MTTYTEYDQTLLEQWQSEDNHAEQFQELLNSYLQKYNHVFSAKSQRKYFCTLIKGLFSTLDRKSLEPIALHFLGKSSVRSMQSLFSRSPLDEERIMKRYQELLTEQLNCEDSMLSVDDSGFEKKGKYSIGVKRQYCGRLGKRENCQIGVFLAYAGQKGYGLVDRELYIPEEWYDASYTALRQKCRLPEEKQFQTKNEIALDMINRILTEGKLSVKWIGCDAAYGNSHAFLDALKLQEGVWYFAATNAKERIFMERPEVIEPTSSAERGRPRKHPFLSTSTVSVKSIAENADIPWEKVTLTEGSKGPVSAYRKIIRCTAVRHDGSRNYIKPGPDIWLYLRKYEDDTIKYFVSNAPDTLEPSELDRAATLRWPIEQCFSECKGYLGMSHYECRSYTGWMRHMQFVMIAHLFVTEIKEIVKKRNSIDISYGCKVVAGIYSF